MSQKVQCYFLSPTSGAPNSRLPVLHYQDVLPLPRSEESATKFLTAREWDKKGTWGHISIEHFHPNTHECYGIFKGSSTLLLGKVGSDTSGGLEVNVYEGDVIVLPAGTAHSSLESSLDYKYIGVYPKGAPQWTSELGKKPVTLFQDTIRGVAMPVADPVFGEDGPLIRLWHRDVLG